jgi:hypothetical protein
MAKSYDFRISFHPAEFSEFAGRKMQAIIYDGRGLGELAFEGSLKEAVAKRAELSAAEKRPHAVFLGMKYRGERKAPGVGKVGVLFGGEGA